MMKKSDIPVSIIDLIRKRKSVRSYTDKPLSSELISQIESYITQLSAPFGVEARVELVNTKIDNQAVKLGTYGVISGANHFLVLIVKDGRMADVGAGYMFEQLILYCTELGLATCWLGGTLRRTDFARYIEFEENEILTLISPVGYKRDKSRLLDRMMRAGAGSDNRKSFGSLFFKDTFDTQLGENEAGDYKIPLEMVRLAPSASNKQPWRILKVGSIFHFYHKGGYFSLNDMGIALCHFELTCQELNLKGHFISQDNMPPTSGLEYVISWITES